MSDREFMIYNAMSLLGGARGYPTMYSLDTTMLESLRFIAKTFRCLEFQYKIKPPAKGYLALSIDDYYGLDSGDGYTTPIKCGSSNEVFLALLEMFEKYGEKGVLKFFGGL